MPPNANLASVSHSTIQNHVIRQHQQRRVSPSGGDLVSDISVCKCLVYDDCDSTLTSLIRLKLRWESHETLLSLNTCCRHFHDILSPVIFRNLNLVCPRLERNAPLKLQALLNRELGKSIYPLVRCLTVSYSPAEVPPSPPHPRHSRGKRCLTTSPVGPSEAIYQLVERLPNLEFLRCIFPLSIKSVWY